jgi:cellulose synthase/poly-beta-1,6-N-acetylglucosamine synthase-like glycosyltransferase
MEIFFVIAAWISLAMVVYVYAGYPLLLVVLSRIRPAPPINKQSIYPSVSLIISCYNEEEILREKLLNSLEIDYPSEKFEILVVSDGSTDQTDTIATQFADKGVRLIRVEGRKGKTACLNRAVAESTGKIIVFSDANALYEADAIGHLVGNFADETVGYVVGYAKYVDVAATAASKSEDSYWQYERCIKKMESSVHSIVGGDGAIYAIRRELYKALRPSDINDFVNPLQIIAQGYRGIYEPAAVCCETTSGSFAKEFKRKVRIVNRSFNGLLRVKSVLNPLKTGVYSLLVISHKLLRWFVPVFCLIFAVATVILACHGHTFFLYMTAFLALFLVLANIGHLLSNYSNTWPILYFPYYFVSVNLAALIGIYQRIKGTTQVIWDPPRQDVHEQRLIPWYIILMQLAAAGLAWYLLWFISTLIPINIVTFKSVFWFSFAVIGYVYFGYPAVLALWAKLFATPVTSGDDLPDVTLIVCAYNEDEVIEEKMENSLAIDYPEEKLHIVVASDGSTDETNAIVERFTGKRVTLFAYPERTGKIGAILQTVPRLSSEILVFSDANTMYAPDALRKLMRWFSDSSVGGVSADVIILNDETSFGESESAYYRYERWIQQKEADIGSIIGADGGMYAIRRELFRPPAPNIILDDFVISMNVALQGKRLVYDAEAKGYEKSNISHLVEFLRKSRVIAGAVQALKQAEGIPGTSHRGLFCAFLSHKLMRWFIPLMLVAILFANICIVVEGGGVFYQLFLLAQTLFYLLAAVGWLIGGESRFSIIGIPFYFCLVNGAAMYGLYKGCLNKQPVTWKKFSRN